MWDNKFFFSYSYLNLINMMIRMLKIIIRSVNVFRHDCFKLDIKLLTQRNTLQSGSDGNLQFFFKLYFQCLIQKGPTYGTSFLIPSTLQVPLIVAGNNFSASFFGKIVV